MPTERLSKRERDNLDEFARIIRQVQRELAVTIKEALLSGDLQRAATRRLHLARVVAVLDQMGAEIDPRARRIVNDAFQRGSEVMARQILELKLPELPQVAVLGTGVSQEAVQMLQDSIVGRLKGAREAVGRQTDDLFAHAGRRAAVRAVLGADGSPEKAGRRLAADLLKNKDIAAQVKLTGRFKLTPGGRNWALPDYTDMVVRTTTREAVVQGSMLRMASNGVNLARVSTHASACPICVPFEGRLVSLGGDLSEYEGETPMDASEVPPYHPRCLVPETMVSGPFDAVTSRVYEGEIVRVAVASGNEFACTPNHPVLTGRGWVEAGDLNDTDDLMRCLDVKAAMILSGVHPHDECVPARIGEIAESLPVVLGEMPVAAEDFHGDGAGSEVYVVRADSLLRGGDKAKGAKPSVERDFVMADVAARGSLDADGPVSEFFGSVGLATDRSMRTLDAGHAGAHWDTGTPQAVADGGRAASDACGDVCAGEALFEIQADDLVRVSEAPPDLATPRGTYRHASGNEGGAKPCGLDVESARDLRVRLASLIEADRVVSVDRTWFRTHVHNLSTPSGWYCAEGLIVHNCAHSLMPVAVRIEQIKRDLASR